MAGDMTGQPQSQAGYALAIEISSALGSVALGRGGDVLEVRAFSGLRMHARDFLPTLDDLLETHAVKPAQLRSVFVSAGPGSFTGLRIGVTASRMIALAGGASVVAIPTLEVIAQNALEADAPPTEVGVVLDAKRGRVYAGSFARQGDAYLPTSEPAEVEPQAFLARQDRACAIMGEGITYHGTAVEASGLPVLPERLWPPRADAVYRLGHARAVRGESDDPRMLVPVYIRPPEAEEKWEQRQRAEGAT
jgi:tRNA threonylcarbamoyladenosine biosynthesis protein TsaB